MQPRAEEPRHRPKVLDGLRYLPRLQAERERQIDDGENPSDAERFLNCDGCPYDYQTRRGLLCGWLPSSEWVGEQCELMPGASICPGYSTSLPEVIEAARMLVWANRGDLVPLVGRRRLPQRATECIDILDGEVKAVERAAMRKQREAMRDGVR